MRWLVYLFCLLLQGCWFIYIPPSMFAAGNSCLAESSYVGQRIKNEQTGKIGTVKELIGRSERCQQAHMPILAQVDYD